jgi:hypothetical protein
MVAEALLTVQYAAEIDIQGGQHIKWIFPIHLQAECESRRRDGGLVTRGKGRVVIEKDPILLSGRLCKQSQPPALNRDDMRAEYAADMAKIYSHHASMECSRAQRPAARAQTKTAGRRDLSTGKTTASMRGRLPYLE